MAVITFDDTPSTPSAKPSRVITFDEDIPKSPPPPTADQRIEEVAGKVAGVPGRVVGNFLSDEAARASAAAKGAFKPPSNMELMLGPYGQIGRFPGVANYLSAPAMAVLDQVVGRPVEALTGIPHRQVGDVAALGLPVAGELVGAADIANFARSTGLSPALARGVLERLNAPAISKAAMKGIADLKAEMAGAPPERIKAAEAIKRRLASDTSGALAPTPHEVLEATGRGEEPLTLMDIGGPKTKGYAGMVARSPKGEGPGVIRRFLDQRVEGLGPTTESIIQRAIALGSTRQAASFIRDQAREKATTLYSDAFEANPVVRSSIVDQLVRDKLAAPLWSRAQAFSRGWVAGTDKPIPDKYSLRTLDQFKRLLDDKITKSYDAKDREAAKLYSNIRDRLMTELDGLDRSPGKLYSQARQVAKEGFDAEKAIDFGRKALSMNPEDIEAEFRKLDPEEQQLARMGVAESLRQQVLGTNVGANPVTSLARKPALQQRLRPFFKTPAEFDKFLDNIQAKDTEFKTRQQVLGGSQMAERQAEDISEEALEIGHFGQAGLYGLQGRIAPALGHFARGVADISRRPNLAVGLEAADILSAPANSGLPRQILENIARERVARELVGHPGPALHQALGLKYLPFVSAGTTDLSSR